MKEELLSIKNNAISLILESTTQKELEEIRIQFFGRNGSVTTLLKQVAKLPVEKRAEAGKTANEIKRILEDTMKRKEETLSKTKPQRYLTLDVTEPGMRPLLGHLHLVTQAIKEITEIFNHIGYTRVRYPEIEWDWYAFTALNFPENHPARDDWETFFIEQKADSKMGSVLLTPHTSSGQIREMQKYSSVIPANVADTRMGTGIQKKRDWIPDQIDDEKNINIKMLNIAKCYRRQSDVSHTPMFHQFEGLVVGKEISIADLKGTLDYFVKSYLGEKRKSRIRPYHFQFTEPSFEVDVTCGVCNGNGCKLCKEGWLELGGSGMVHPNVLSNGGIDPKEYTGFAFGWGVERVLMMKEGIEIDDLRTLYSNDLNFLEQF
jgi:phenylalanyl-tRNA synthetase alpha chain